MIGDVGAVKSKDRHQVSHGVDLSFLPFFISPFPFCDFRCPRQRKRGEVKFRGSLEPKHGTHSIYTASHGATTTPLTCGKLPKGGTRLASNGARRLETWKPNTNRLEEVGSFSLIKPLVQPYFGLQHSRQIYSGLVVILPPTHPTTTLTPPHRFSSHRRVPSRSTDHTPTLRMHHYQQYF
jgi:hypothetical protein